MSIPFGLEVLDPLKYVFAHRQDEVFVADTQVAQKVDELVHLEFVSGLLQNLHYFGLGDPQVVDLSFGQIFSKRNLQLLSPGYCHVNEGPDIPIFTVKFHLLLIFTLRFVKHNLIANLTLPFRQYFQFFHEHPWTLPHSILYKPTHHALAHQVVQHFGIFPCQLVHHQAALHGIVVFLSNSVQNHITEIFLALLVTFHGHLYQPICDGFLDLPEDTVFEKFLKDPFFTEQTHHPLLHLLIFSHVVVDLLQEGVDESIGFFPQSYRQENSYYVFQQATSLLWAKLVQVVHQ